MAEFKNEALGVSFSLPDRITIRQQMAFYSVYGWDVSSKHFERMWQAALPLVENWQCPSIPDPKAINLDEKVEDRSKALILMWAAARAADYIADLENVPKN